VLSGLGGKSLPAGVSIRRKFLYTKKLCELSVLGGEKYGLGLRISPKIAEANWRQIAKKHGVHSITEMIKYAIGGSFTAVEF